jgi:hypothetical protein
MQNHLISCTSQILAIRTGRVTAAQPCRLAGIRYRTPPCALLATPLGPVLQHSFLQEAYG